MNPREKDAYDARRLYNYLRLMETRGARLKEVVEDADKMALEGKVAQ